MALRKGSSGICCSDVQAGGETAEDDRRWVLLLAGVKRESPVWGCRMVRIVVGFVAYHFFLGEKSSFGPEIGCREECVVYYFCLREEREWTGPDIGRLEKCVIVYRRLVGRKDRIAQNTDPRVACVIACRCWVEEQDWLVVVLAVKLHGYAPLLALKQFYRLHLVTELEKGFPAVHCC